MRKEGREKQTKNTRGNDKQLNKMVDLDHIDNYIKWSGLEHST